jgi:hypothetical protein
MKCFLFALFLALPVSLACAQETNAATSPTDPALVPVNQMSRFVLIDSLPRLAVNFIGAPANLPMLRAGEFQRDQQTITTQVPEAQGKPAVWVQMNAYWIEPVTPPPSQGEPLVVPIDDMRVAEVEGEVTLVTPAEKSAKPTTTGANENMEVPSHAEIVTADTGSAAVMIGGHTSVRLVPNSRVRFAYDATGATPRLEVVILQGALFCKVGKLPTGRYADVAVRGPVGAAASIGSADFFVQADPVSIHACIIQGKLLMGDSIPLAIGNMGWYPPDVEATSQTGPQICHWPRPGSHTDRAEEDARTLNLALLQVRTLNAKINALLNATGAPLSSDDQAYLAKVPRITWYEQATSAR